MAERRRITGLRALYWLERLSNRNELRPHEIDQLRGDFRQHIETDLTKGNRKRRANGGARKAGER